jgi:hypothetical protein
MKHYIDVTLDCADAQVGIYEARLADAGIPAKFPLPNCQVTHSGSRAVLSVKVPGKRNFELDRLIHAAEPTQTDRNGEAFSVTGQSEQLYRQGIAPEDAEMTFSIKMVKKHSAAIGSGE